MVFGRKKPAAQPAPTAPASEPDPAIGHIRLLRHLRENENEDPLQRPRIAGQAIFDFIYRTIAHEGRGARIEDLIAILASCGGFGCIVATLDMLKQQGTTPQQAGMLEVGGKDGNLYYFGDLPNEALWENEMSLLSLTLGAAHACGGQVSAEMVGETMQRVARTVGGEEFGSAENIPDGHRPSVPPINFVHHLWPQVREGLDLYEVPSPAWPATMGYALQHAIELSKGVIDPTLAARIAIECAVPMAKLDPRRFA